VRPNVIHLPKRDFVLFSHLAFNGLLSTGCEEWWELCDVRDVENLEDWSAEGRRNRERGVKGGMIF
jgi:hypothetical protein